MIIYCSFLMIIFDDFCPYVMIIFDDIYNYVIIWVICGIFTVGLMV